MKILNLKFLLLLLILLVIIQAGLIFVLSKQERKNYIDEKNLPVHYSYFSGLDFYKEAYKQAAGQAIVTDGKIYGGIVPHHLMVKDKIAAFFAGIRNNDYETIILIGPNHFLSGQNDIITSRAKWATPYGELMPDLNLAGNLKNFGGASIEENLFINEHSISGLVGFIKKNFPNARFAPIIVRPETTAKESEQLARVIKNNTDADKTLILASVDFSHYQPVAVADWHDAKSRNVIENFNFNDIYNLEIDSAPSIYTLLKYLELIKAQKSELIFATNSGKLINKPDEPTTSHNFYYFTEGDKTNDSLVNFLFFGDIMLDRHVKEVMDKNGGVDYLLKNLAGEEKRFFQGIDIIGANLEGAITAGGKYYPPEISIDFAFDPKDVAQLKNYNFNFFSIANNHVTDQGKQGYIETRENLDKLDFNYSGCPDRQVGECNIRILDIKNIKIAVLSYSMVYGILDEEKMLAQITDAKTRADLVIVNMHWGVEYEQASRKNQQTLARKIIDAGADMIIGGHPHVVQEMEVYKSKPIFYSLGNFIFDQYFSPETQEGLGVGLLVDNGKTEITLLPFKSKASQVELMNGDDKQEFLNWLAESSKVSKEYREQIEQGSIIIN